MNSAYSRIFSKIKPTRAVSKLGVDLPNILVWIMMTAVVGVQCNRNCRKLRCKNSKGQGFLDHSSHYRASKRLHGKKRDCEISDKVENVSQLVSRLEEMFPGIKDRIFDDQDRTRQFVNIFVNGANIQVLAQRTQNLRKVMSSTFYRQQRAENMLKGSHTSLLLVGTRKGAFVFSSKDGRKTGRPAARTLRERKSITSLTTGETTFCLLP